MVSHQLHKAIQTILIIIIVFAGGLLRYTYNKETYVINPVSADAAYYLKYAHNLLDYSTFSKDIRPPPLPDAYWAPGYPAFLAAVIKLSKIMNLDTYNLILLSQVALGTASILLCFLVALTFLPGYWPLLPASMVSLSPHLVSLGSYALSETLFCFLLLLALYMLSKALAAAYNRSLWLSAGTVFAMAYLVNPVSAILPVCLVAALLLYQRLKQPKKADNNTVKPVVIVLFLLPLLLFAALWSVRGTISVPAERATSSDRLLTNLVIGMYPDYHQKWRDSILKPEKEITIPGQGLDSSYQLFLRELMRRISSEPMQMLHWYAIGKPIQLWDWNILTGHGDIYIYEVEYSLYHKSKIALASYSIMHALHFGLVVCCALGALYIVASKRYHGLMPATIYTSVVAISLVYVATQAEARYSIPIRPELYLGSTFFLWKAGQWLAHLRASAKRARP